MIGRLQGNIVDKTEPGRLVLDVGGVGYDVETSLQTFFHLENAKNPVALHIHTVVREDALLLYGFLDQTERALFRALIRISGVGPKMAIALLSSVTPNEFMHCVREQELDKLVRLPGVGKKTAARLLIEMKEYVARFSDGQPALDTSGNRGAEEEAISALETLGYKRINAVKIMAKINDGKQTSEQLIRMALKQLS